MTFNLNFFLQAGGSASALSQFLPLILVLFIIYFFFIRPQAKKQKEQMKFNDEMKKGDEVVTTSGIVGRISKLEDDGTVSLQLDQKTFIKIMKSAISKEMTASYSTKEESK